MNCELMCQYIEFVADRLLVELGCPKQWRRGMFLKLSMVHGSHIDMVIPWLTISSQSFWNVVRKPIWFYGNDFIGRKDKLFRKASWWISKSWSHSSFGQRSKLKRKCFFTRLRFLNISRLFKYRNGSDFGRQVLSAWPWLVKVWAWTESYPK